MAREESLTHQSHIRCHHQVAYLPPEYLISSGSAAADGVCSHKHAFISQYLACVCYPNNMTLPTRKCVRLLHHYFHPCTVANDCAVDGVQWDTYSFAILLAFLFTEQPPYHQLHNNQIFMQVRTRGISQFTACNTSHSPIG